MMKKRYFLFALLAAFTTCTVFAGCSGSAGSFDIASAEDSPKFVSRLPQAKKADQLFVVCGMGRTTAYVSMHEKNADGRWKQVMTTPGFIGKEGLGKTREGDNRTPAGTYRFNCAFGIKKDPGCSAFEYHQATDDDYWSGDQRTGYQYNRMVSIKEYPDLDRDASEHIVDYQEQYKYCLNVSWNENGEKGLGSAIFLHCLGPQKPYSGGCIAIPEEKMVTVLKNVKKDCVVVIGPVKKLAPDLAKEWEL